VIVDERDPRLDRMRAERDPIQTAAESDLFYLRLGVLLDEAVRAKAKQWPGRPFGKLDGETIGTLFDTGARKAAAR
jgi:hypothetical protein